MTSSQIKQAFAFFEAHPTGTLHLDWHTQYSKEQFIRWFRACLQNKINRNERPRGKRDCDEYRALLFHLGSRLNNNGVIREHEFFFDRRLKSRLGHKIFRED